jgi:hypothetical protein
MWWMGIATSLLPPLPSHLNPSFTPTIVQVPIIIHRRDLQRIAPLWLSKTMEIRNDRHNWPKYALPVPFISSSIFCSALLDLQ